MRPIRTLSRILAVPALATAAVLPAAAPLAAEDCGAEYVQCLSEAGVLASSDVLHEKECYGEYWTCVSRRLLYF